MEETETQAQPRPPSTPILIVGLDGVLDDYDRILRIGGRDRLIDNEWHLLHSDEARPRPWAALALRQFRTAGWRVVILTSRTFAKAAEITKAWLDKYDFQRDGLVFVPSVHVKPLAINAMRPKPRLMVDDFMAGYETPCPRFLSEAYEGCRAAGTTVDIYRNNWSEIVERWLGNTTR